MSPKEDPPGALDPAAKKDPKAKKEKEEEDATVPYFSLYRYADKLVRAGGRQRGERIKEDCKYSVCVCVFVEVFD